MSREYNPENAGETSGMRESGSTIRDRAGEFTSKVKDKASHVGSSVSETVGRQRDNAAAGLNRMAATIHNKAGSVPGGEKAERVVHSIASGMESTASYLRDHNFRDMGDDLIGVCRRHPAQALISAVLIGFLVGRAARR